ncbi:DNA mismatch repair protein [Nostoc sp. CHAB 5844]|nr:DNA mismatch repair protein [Nostoc sp. CHAB 5844]
MSEINIGDYLAHPLVRYRNHLEFNGYHVDEEDEMLLCRHPRKHGLIVKHIPNRGVLVRILYSCNLNINRGNLLEYVNELNLLFMFMKAYIDNSGSNLYMETFCEGEYDRTNFSIILDNIEYDMEMFINHHQTREYLL